MSPHRLRRGALHLPARRSRQNANLFLREPLGASASERDHSVNSIVSRGGAYNEKGQAGIEILQNIAEKIFLFGFGEEEAIKLTT